MKRNEKFVQSLTFFQMIHAFSIFTKYIYQEFNESNVLKLQENQFLSNFMPYNFQCNLLWGESWSQTTVDLIRCFIEEAPTSRLCLYKHLQFYNMKKKIFFSCVVCVVLCRVVFLTHVSSCVILIQHNTFGQSSHEVKTKKTPTQMLIFLF